LTNWTRRLLKKGSVPTKSASGRSRANAAKADSISSRVLALWNLQAHRAGSRFHIPYRRLGTRHVGRIYQYGNASGRGHQLAQ
jgi:hypothetical protein